LTVPGGAPLPGSGVGSLPLLTGTGFGVAEAGPGIRPAGEADLLADAGE
jgi:hypothetical protein